MLVDTSDIRNISFCIFLALCCACTQVTWGQEDNTRSQGLNISDHKIIFDPATAELGATGHFLGLKEVRISVVSRADDKCIFKYYTSGCGGVEQIKLIEVPVDAGEIVFEKDGYGAISDALPQSTRVVYSRDGYIVRARVPGTDEFVEFTKNGRPASEMFPQVGDKIKFRYIVFDSPDFESHLPSADFTHPMEFDMGSDKTWPWLTIAMEDISVGDERRVQVPVKVAAGARKWLTKPGNSQTIYATIRLVSLERATH
ncbi:FKBP-type peptidyl-prolyl cis-trans isomerase [Planctomycetaceae bacterium SH139]